VVGVLVMAYGGPARPEDVEPYLLDVRGGRPTPPGLAQMMLERYRAIGGGSPILDRTCAQAAALERLLNQDMESRAYVGMRHWQPRIAGALEQMRADRIRRAIGLVMAPHYSRLSVGAYFREVDEAAAGIEVRRLESWHVLPEYVDTVAALVRDGLAAFHPESRPHAAGAADVHVLYTAHSLPSSVLVSGDPYPTQLEETVAALAVRLPGVAHSFAYQSAGATSEAWLGPDAGEAIRALAAAGVRSVLVAPIGFTCDNVEILYDIDIEYRSLADRIGMQLRRIPMPNDNPLLMRGLARLVREEMSRAGWL
jgi:ferrochelatase